MIIAIDFQGGQHGNFLEFVCNKFLAGVACGDSPFNEHGASHIKRYTTSKIFHCGHYFMQNPVMPKATERVVSIQMDTDDLLPLSCISLLRAGDLGIDPNLLHVDTYHKFNNIHYRLALDNLIASFFQDNLQRSYQAVKDDTWPNITDHQSFLQLPQWIQDECAVVHGVRPLMLDATHPHCPRSILREFFKIGFAKPEQSGFMQAQRRMLYDDSLPVLHFAFGSFYDTSRFIAQIMRVADWTGMSINNCDQLVDLHGEFLSKQPYAKIKSTTDMIYERILSGRSQDLRGLNLLQESYLDSRFEQAFGKAAPTNRDTWFESGEQVRAYFDA